MKPDVVLFGELLPAEAMAQAQTLAEEADLMLCIGSSLEVYPVASLPAATLGAGGRLAVVTRGPTPYDSEAEVRLGGDVGGRAGHGDGRARRLSLFQRLPGSRAPPARVLPRLANGRAARLASALWRPRLLSRETR